MRALLRKFNSLILMVGAAHTAPGAAYPPPQQPYSALPRNSYKALRLIAPLTFGYKRSAARAGTLLEFAA